MGNTEVGEAKVTDKRTRARMYSCSQDINQGKRSGNKSNMNQLNCLYTNIDVISNKLHELSFRINQCKTKPHIVFICEVKPKNARYQLAPEEIMIPGYKLFTNLEGSSHRGIAVYVQENISVWQVELSTKFDEALWIRMRVNGNEETLMGCIYRSPQSTKDNNALLRQLLVEANSGNETHVLVVGDFNYPKINWQSWTTDGGLETEEYKFVEAVRDAYLHQHVSQSTRGRGETLPSLLDLIMTKEAGMISCINYEAPIGKSDHSVLQFNIELGTNELQHPQKRYYFDKGNYDAMRQYMNGIVWDEELKDCMDDVEEQWRIIMEKLTFVKENFIPCKVTTPGSHQGQGRLLDKNTLQAVKKKHRAWQRYMETKDKEKYKEYAKARNKARTLTRKLQKNIEKDISLSAKTNPKKFWRYVKNKVSVKEGVAELVKTQEGNKEILTTTDKEKAQVLANFFGSVFTKEPDTTPPLFKQRNYKKRLETIEVTRSEVIKKLKELKIHKSPGPDEIHPRLLKELSKELGEPLQQLFNTSLSNGRLPNIWKRATVSAIFKKGSKKNPTNYRPVSLTCILCKVLESIVRDRLMSHVIENNLLSINQFGFVKGRSIYLQLLKVMNDWTSILDRGNELDVIYLDIKKAFDTVPYRRLMLKLESYGLGKNVLQWLEALLVGRKQKVVVRGSSSEWHDVTSGVPQGSVVGPLMFILYINDLPDNIKSSLVMFADDTKCYREITSSKDTDYKILQEDINKLQSWSQDWLLQFHPEKCKTMTVSKKKERELRTYSMITNQGTVTLDQVEKEKDLGIIIDNNLTFEDHMNGKINKANSVMGIIRRSFVHMDKEIFLRLYKALVRPHLEFGAIIWNPTRKKDITSIENVQRRSTRMIPGLKGLNYEERLKALNLPTLVYRRLRGEMIETYKIANRKYDVAVAPVLEYEDRAGPVTRGHCHKLAKIRWNTRTRQNYFTNRIVNTWNSLPAWVVEAPSTFSFERRLDRYWEDQEVKLNYTAALSRPPHASPVNEREDLDI